MNMLSFIVSLMTILVISHVTANNFGSGSYFPGLSYPSSGLWNGGWGGEYNLGSGFGGFQLPSSYGYLPKGIPKPKPVLGFTKGGYRGAEGFGNGGLILVLVLVLVLMGTIRTNTTLATSKNDVIISFL